MNLFRDRKIIEQEYLDWIAKDPEIKDCAFTVISFLESAGYLRDRKSVGKPGSNRRFINNLPNRKFAELTINCSQRPEYDYNYDDELEFVGFADVFTTSDGSAFDNMESAIDHEVWWLNRRHKEESNG